MRLSNYIKQVEPVVAGNESVAPIFRLPEPVAAIDAEMWSLCAGIEAAEESIQSMLKYRALLNSSGQKEAGFYKAVSTGIEMFANRYNVDLCSGRRMPGIEDMNEGDKKAALESAAMDFIKKMWGQIVEAFKKLWEKFKEYFKKVNDKSHKNAKDAQEVFEQIKDVMKNWDRNPKADQAPPDIDDIKPEDLFEDFMKSAAYTGDAGILLPLNYLDREVTDEELIAQVRDIQTTVKLMDKTMGGLNQTFGYVRQIFMDSIDDSIDGVIENFDMTKDNMNTMFQTLTSDVENIPACEKILLTEEAFFATTGLKFHQIKNDSIKAFSGFIYGGTMYFFYPAQDDAFTYLPMTVDKTEVKHARVKMYIMSGDNLQLFGSEVERLSHEAEEAIKTFYKYCNRLENDYDVMSKGVNRMLRDYAAHYDKLHTGFRAIRVILGILKMYLNQSNACYYLLTDTSRYYTTLANYMVRWYKAR